MYRFTRKFQKFFQRLPHWEGAPSPDPLGTIVLCSSASRSINLPLLPNPSTEKQNKFGLTPLIVEKIQNSKLQRLKMSTFGYVSLS